MKSITHSLSIEVVTEGESHEVMDMLSRGSARGLKLRHQQTDLRTRLPALTEGLCVKASTTKA